MSREIMTSRIQAEALIKAKEAKAGEIYNLMSKLEREWYTKSQAEQEKAKLAIQQKYSALYSPRVKALRDKRERALDKATSLRIRHAATLCGIPVDSLMIEWVHDWEGWKPTGRKGKLEVFLPGAMWPKGDYSKPNTGSVIIRIIGKNGHPTTQATFVYRQSMDTSFRKFQWGPDGTTPKAFR